MHTIILSLHNVFRWVCLAIIAYVVFKSFTGWMSNREWSNKDEKMLLIGTIAVDVQFLLGLILYFFLSPITKINFKEFKTIVTDPTLRFFVLEHSFTMFLVTVFIHLAKIMYKKKKIIYARYRTIFFYYSLSLVAILIGIPWFRPLIPGL
ncbi:MAG: hypothetical protein H7A23_12725 [Leptospiraceae bacterium]|nr:hypothetical protein [Leptospiraceae bacterium]MCP5495414.1 hypothetical protein [Leptospiraceae bacterium]